MRLARTLSLLVAVLVLGAPSAVAQTKGAVRTKYQEPVYPENLFKTQKQGNVLLVGRIDREGRVSDLHAVATSHKDFVPAAIDAVKAWQFRPAMRDGKPIEIFVNVGVRFRIQNEKRGQITRPILGDIAISPADASGRATAPEGVPLRRGVDPALRAEILLDVPPVSSPSTVPVKVEAVSPSGKHFQVFQPPVALAPGAVELKFPIVAQIGAGWEDGVWMLMMTVNGLSVGGGQFWLARDPSHFSFVIPSS